MRLVTATVVAALLFGAALGLLAWADEATDAAAIAGGVTLVLSGALFGLIALAWRWRVGARAYVATAVEAGSFYEDLASAFDDTTEGYDDAPAMRAAN